MSRNDHPVPAAVREFLAAYDELLPDVRFPDVDQAFLSALVSDTHEHAARVDRAVAALEAARAALAEARATLVRNARKALAYAMVYAEGDDATRDRLDRLALAADTARDIDRERMSGSRTPTRTPRRGAKRSPRASPAKSPFPRQTGRSAG